MARRILFLDDSERRQDSFKLAMLGQDVIQVRTVAQCCDALETQGPFDLVCLDHDLGGAHFQNSRSKSCGAEVARFIRDTLSKDKRPKNVILHSWNDAGAKEQDATLREVGIKPIVKRFSVSRSSPYDQYKA